MLGSSCEGHWWWCSSPPSFVAGAHSLERWVQVRQVVSRATGAGGRRVKGGLAPAFARAWRAASRQLVESVPS